jgi:NMD protein affecting ribosome stability and mRNA decay
MAECPSCGRDTLHNIKTDDPSVLAKCNKCGYYRYKKVKMTVIEFEDIIYSLVTQMIKKSKPTHSVAECLALIVKRTGHSVEQVTEAYNNARARRPDH